MHNINNLKKFKDHIEKTKKNKIVFIIFGFSKKNLKVNLGILLISYQKNMHPNMMLIFLLMLTIIIHQNII